ncbi:MAG TPA: hypothetical protein VNW29_06440 [Candidatus Sulfotelmatobacter sp.]|jgi:hypothetical protein|nr:hypothetical protein [Candidatus Sulfotelmatobacter sp.]
MLKQFNKHRLILTTIVIITFPLIITTQSNPPFFFLFPILLFSFFIYWYLYKEIQKENQEHLKTDFLNIQKEQEAQKWLHKSFLPKIRILTKKEMRVIILTSGIVLLSFIFLWTFFVAGITSAILNTLAGTFFFLGFIIYALYAPRKFTHIFNRVPKRYQHHRKNDWIHGYLLLLPVSILGFFVFSLITTAEDILKVLENTILFLFSYTFLFICLYALWYLYKDYQKETAKSAKIIAKTIFKGEHK